MNKFVITQHVEWRDEEPFSSRCHTWDGVVEVTSSFVEAQKCANEIGHGEEPWFNGVGEWGRFTTTRKIWEIGSNGRCEEPLVNRMFGHCE